MGVDLALLPVEYEHNNSGSAFSRLTLERRKDLWDSIEALPQQPIHSVTGYLGDGFRTITQTPYGTVLTWVYAEEFSNLNKHSAIQDNSFNAAIWAFLATLPPKTKIILYWH